jgi:hypothetical protein
MATPTVSGAYIRVEVWSYNYGPSRFIDYVRLKTASSAGYTAADTAIK